MQTKEYFHKFYLKNKERYKKVHASYYRKNIKKFKKWQREWYMKNKDTRKKTHKVMKEDVINHYGGKCACCGEKNIKFLCVDHINNDGAKHRKIVGGHINRWLINNNYPEGFQILCYNCNCAKAFYGVCPHNNIPNKEDV